MEIGRPRIQSWLYHVSKKPKLEYPLKLLNTKTALIENISRRSSRAHMIGSITVARSTSRQMY